MSVFSSVVFFSTWCLFCHILSFFSYFVFFSHLMSFLPYFVFFSDMLSFLSCVVIRRAMLVDLFFCHYIARRRHLLILLDHFQFLTMVLLSYHLWIGPLIFFLSVQSCCRNVKHQKQRLQLFQNLTYAVVFIHLVQLIRFTRIPRYLSLPPSLSIEELLPIHSMSIGSSYFLLLFLLSGFIFNCQNLMSL